MKRIFKSEREAFWFGVRDGLLIIVGSAIIGTVIAVIIAGVK